MTGPFRVAAFGWPVFPCRASDKRPYTGHGFKDATTDEKQIYEWWRRWPVALIGVPTGIHFDVVDVDIDPGKGIDGRPAYERVVAAGLITGTPKAVVRTRRGGWHYYVAPTDIRGGKRALRCGLDYRGNGQYVVVPPSNGYTIVQGWNGAADGAADWPGILNLLDPQPAREPYTGPRTGNLDGLVRFLLRQPEGARHEPLAWACWKAVREGVDDLTALIEASVASGHDRRDAERTAASYQRRVAT